MIESYGRRRRRFPGALILGIGILAGLASVLVLAAPRVVELSPPPGAEDVPATAPIRIAFSGPMDARSVEGRLRLEPEGEVEVVWQDDATLRIEPLQPWPEGATVSVRLGAGARSSRSLPLLTSQSTSFTIGSPRLVYLWPSGGPADLYMRTLEEEGATRLTETPLGILDFSIGGSGTMIVYTAEREGGGTDLRLLDLISGEDRLAYACPEEARCVAATLSPDSEWLTFEISELVVSAAGHLVSAPSRVWAVPLRTEDEPISIGEQDHVASRPAWTPSGWLTYYDSTLGALALVSDPLSPAVDPSSLIINELGSAATWSPDGAYMIFPEVVFPEEEGSAAEDAEFFSHLYRVEAASGIASDLSGERAGLVEDASPAYSPDGNWIAFARKYLDRERWTLGRQVWLMRPDGTQARQLTDDPNFNHSALAWSPDSTRLAYMRFNQIDIARPAEIWWIDVSLADPQLLSEGGYLPQWIP